jgi:hypothetical protein
MIVFGVYLHIHFEDRVSDEHIAEELLVKKGHVGHRVDRGIVRLLRLQACRKSCSIVGGEGITFCGLQLHVDPIAFLLLRLWGDVESLDHTGREQGWIRVVSDIFLLDLEGIAIERDRVLTVVVLEGVKLNGESGSTLDPEEGFIEVHGDVVEPELAPPRQPGELIHAPRIG